MIKLVLDEIYTYVGKKSSNFYIFTALAYDSNNNKSLPLAKTYHSDGALVYPQMYGQKSIAKKSVQTNLIESMNSQIRQYVSSSKRKTKCYAKSFDELNKKLAMVVINKIMG